MIHMYLAMLETPDDKEKMSLLYLTYRDYLSNIAQSILRNKHDAEDVLHQTFLRIASDFTKIGEVSSHQTRNYLVIIVRGLSLNLKNKKNSRAEISLEELEDPDEYLQLQDMHQDDIEYLALHELLAALPPIHRDVLYLMYFEGFSVKAIAKTLQLSEGAVKKRLERARKALEKALAEGSWS